MLFCSFCCHFRHARTAKIWISLTNNHILSVGGHSWGSTVSSFDSLLEVALPGGYRYLQTNTSRQSGIPRAQCLRSPVLLQIRLLRRVTGGMGRMIWIKNSLRCCNCHGFRCWRCTCSTIPRRWLPWTLRHATTSSCTTGRRPSKSCGLWCKTTCHHRHPSARTCSNTTLSCSGMVKGHYKPFLLWWTSFQKPGSTSSFTFFGRRKSMKLTNSLR